MAGAAVFDGHLCQRFTALDDRQKASRLFDDHLLGDLALLLVAVFVDIGLGSGDGFGAGLHLDRAEHRQADNLLVLARNRMESLILSVNRAGDREVLAHDVLILDDRTRAVRGEHIPLVVDVARARIRKHHDVAEREGGGVETDVAALQRTERPISSMVYSSASLNSGGVLSSETYSVSAWSSSICSKV